MRRFGLLLLLIPLIASCANNDAERYFELQEEMATIVSEAGEDCQVMAEGLQAFGDEKGEELRMVENRLLNLSRVERAAFKENHKDRAEAIREKMAGLDLCAGHPGVRRAIANLDKNP